MLSYYSNFSLDVKTNRVFKLRSLAYYNYCAVWRPLTDTMSYSYSDTVFVRTKTIRKQGITMSGTGFKVRSLLLYYILEPNNKLCKPHGIGQTPKPHKIRNTRSYDDIFVKCPLHPL